MNLKLLNLKLKTMNWRNSVASPQGYRYFIQIYNTIEEIAYHDVPYWFDSTKMGEIFLYPVDGTLKVFDYYGPDTTVNAGWVYDLGYPAVGDLTRSRNLYTIVHISSSTSRLGYVRYPYGDRMKDTTYMYCWTVGIWEDSWVYTDTLNCTTSTIIWAYNREQGTWSQSSTTVSDLGPFTDYVTCIITNYSSNVPAESITMNLSTGTYMNAVQVLVAGPCDKNTNAVITVNGTGTWRWTDTQDSTSPRTYKVGRYGDWLAII